MLETELHIVRQILDKGPFHLRRIWQKEPSGYEKLPVISVHFHRQILAATHYQKYSNLLLLITFGWGDTKFSLFRFTALPQIISTPINFSKYWISRNFGCQSWRPFEIELNFKSKAFISAAVTMTVIFTSNLRLSNIWNCELALVWTFCPWI